MVESELLKTMLIACFIFLARICDVSIGTIRIVFVSRGLKVASALLGFFEVLIWLIAIREIMNNLNNPINYIAYAGGFAVGNFVGLSIEHKISLGFLIIRIITQKEASRLVESLKKHDYGVTSINAEGLYGPVQVVFTIIKRKDLDTVKKLIKKFNPNAFFTIEDTRVISERFNATRSNPFLRFIGLKRK